VLSFEFLNRLPGGKMKKSSILLTLLIVFISSQAFGTPFGDSTKYWSGWHSWQHSDNVSDQIGVPIFPGTPSSPGTSAGSYDIVGGKLQRITFNYQLQGSSFESYIKPMDLFIDRGANHTWDYAVRLYGAGTGAGTYQMYSISLSSAPGTPGYVLSNTAWVASGIHHPGDYDIRDWHPVAIGTGVSQTDPHDVYFDGWKYGSGPHTTYFDFGPGGLDLGQGPFEFSWTVNCANDVVREHGDIQTPEPATMILLGSGLLGLAGLAKRKFRKQ
jgi:hypothetical protein